jgi:5-methylcytosine-specific restriction endonuclease McrA
MKQCGRCGKKKSLSEFFKYKSRKDGLQTWCKKCQKEYSASHLENRKEYTRKWRNNHPNENTMRQREYQRKYQKNNLEKVLERIRRWYADNPGKYSQKSSARRARKNHADGKFTSDEWKMLKEKYKYMCLMCKRSEPEIKLVPDHVLPLSRGGKNVIENIQPLCVSCNSKKYTKQIDFRKLENVTQS